MPAPLGDSSKQVVTKATEVKSESQPQPAAVGIQAVQPIAMGIPMDPTMMQQMLQGTQFLSPVTALSSQPQLAKSGEDHAQHRRPSPASAHHAAEDGEAVVSIVHHTPDQSAIKRDAPVDLTSEVPQRKRPRASAVDGVLSGTPPTLGSPVHGLVKREEPEAANSKGRLACAVGVCMLDVLCVRRVLNRSKLPSCGGTQRVGNSHGLRPSLPGLVDPPCLAC